MLLPATRHGKPPDLVSSDLLRRWSLGDYTTPSTIYDMDSGNTTAYSGSAPTTIDSPTGQALDTGGSTYWETALNDYASLGYGVVVHFVAKWNWDDLGVSSVLLSHGDNNDSGTAYNELCMVQKHSDDTYRFIWENSSQANVITYGDALPAHVLTRWHYGMFVRTYDSATGGFNVHLFINGSLYKSGTTSSANNPSGGSSGQWVVGALQGGSSVMDGAISYISVENISTNEYTVDQLQDVATDNFERLLLVDQPFSELQVDVRVDDSSGTLRDIGSSMGEMWDWHRDGRIYKGLDDNVESMDITFHRRQGSLILSPLVEGSRMNIEPETASGPDGGSYSPRLALGRDIEMRYARTGPHQEVQAWQDRFKGEIERISETSLDAVTIQAKDVGRVLIQGSIEDDGLQLPVDSSLGSGGCGSTSAPLETAIQDLLDEADSNNWIAPAITLTVEDSPGWCKFQRDVNRQPIMDCIEQMAMEAGGSRCEYKWNGETEDFELTLWRPHRETTHAWGRYRSRMVSKISGIARDRTKIRNDIRVFYRSTETSAPTYTYDGEWYGQNQDGEPLLSWVRIDAADLSSTSITDNGRSFAEATEGSTSNLDTKAEVEDYCESMLRDMMDPETQLSLSTMHACLEMEIGDYIDIAANDEQFTDDQSGAPHSYDVSFGGGSNGGRLKLRAKPAGAFKKWLNAESRVTGMYAPTSPENILLARNDTNIQMAVRGALERIKPVTSSTGLTVLGNGAFANRSRGPSFPPDGWDVRNGAAWGTDFDFETSNVNSGDVAIKGVNVGPVKNIKSVDFPVEGGALYEFEVSGYVSTASENWQAAIYFYSGPNESGFLSASAINPNNTSYETKRIQATAPSSARFGRVRLGAQSAGTANYYFDFAVVRKFQPAFEGYRSGSTQSIGTSTAAKVQLNGETFDYGGNFDTSNYEFVAPIDGWYEFVGQITENGSGSRRFSADLYIDTGGGYSLWCTSGETYWPGNPTYTVKACVVSSGRVYLSAGDKVALYGTNEDGSNSLVVAVGATATFLRGTKIAQFS